MSDEEIRELERAMRAGDRSAGRRLAALETGLPRVPFHELAAETLQPGTTLGALGSLNMLTTAVSSFVNRLGLDGELDLPPRWHLKCNAYRLSTGVSIEVVHPWNYTSVHKPKEIHRLVVELARVFGCPDPHFGDRVLEVECSPTPPFDVLAPAQVPPPSVILRHAAALRDETRRLRTEPGRIVPNRPT